ncbi:MAG: tripartite tricarboxylate transporter substrate binding protein [Aminobacterium sp.]|jgi:tripartite-type tricarboxylate transporter receptor subunit TctC|uniref:Tripartite tricarboxylate transporter family receptor n=1 Tax=bioreactor metagenome TaxID=1076179 RepID=A0A645BHI9_9ZZZZ|nr:MULTISPECIES: tripartite tricarboxylate transporter substrate binding protein [unclassified Aminobacterium]MDD2207494.1 tripartite tricarboxylate transporter substrate binding protein [Aminobacterium sp.]MDD3426460.1 tripartite tricarboxylate transporter substrate binding protein [Aminobacterium sp.]MDD3708262.1 tripartite tricarboxylate transporter substrate binding protein [Aminobacterium sp.]MDD4229472.1 tripartite tricarboxylate transporter substrate binding protein [Aminobacterium sp.]
MKKFMSCLALVALVTLCFGSFAFAAETFPQKNIKIIVPFAPGGGVDVTCRLMAEVAPKYMNGKKIVVENMPGGGAVIGQTFVSKAKADGYTILAYTSSVVTNPMTKKTTYTHKSFKPIAMYCFDPEIVMVPENSPYKTLKEFIGAAKTKEISLATPGYSTSHHIACLILENRLGVKFGYVHNESAAMQVQQLLGGHVEAGMMALGEASGFIKDGTMRALGVMTNERPKDFSFIPTFKEEGTDLVWGAFRGLAVPEGTSDETVKALDELFGKIINDEDFAARMAKAGYPLVYRNAPDFGSYVEEVATELEKIVPTLNQ